LNKQHHWIYFFKDDWKLGGLMSDQPETLSIAQKVRKYLAKQNPLTWVELEKLYLETSSKSEDRASVRAALYRFSIGTPVAKRDKTKTYYALRFQLPVSDDVSEEVFLSLPGIPLELIHRDRGTSNEIDNIIRRLIEKYGEVTIDYWCKAAQYRTVDHAGKGMRYARGRDKEVCKLCNILNQIRKSYGLSAMEPRAIRASHIISRKTIFWLLVNKIDLDGYNIFTNEGARLIREGLIVNPYHSDPQFIISLCSEHDKSFLNAIKQSE
jgi:hypothetical protein